VGSGIEVGSVVQHWVRGICGLDMGGESGSQPRSKRRRAIVLSSGGDHDGGGHDVDCRMEAVALVKQAYYYGACKQKQPVNSEWDGMEWKGGKACDGKRDQVRVRIRRGLLALHTLAHQHALQISGVSISGTTHQWHDPSVAVNQRHAKRPL